jgi:hypothetical protein
MRYAVMIITLHGAVCGHNIASDRPQYKVSSHREMTLNWQPAEPTALENATPTITIEGLERVVGDD